MILSLLACFIGIIIGIMAFIHYSSFDRFDKTFAAGILFFISCESDLIFSPLTSTSAFIPRRLTATPKKRGGVDLKGALQNNDDILILIISIRV